MRDKLHSVVGKRDHAVSARFVDCLHTGHLVSQIWNSFSQDLYAYR